MKNLTLIFILLSFSFWAMASDHKLSVLKSYNLPIKGISGMSWYGKDKNQLAIVSDKDDIVYLLDWMNIDKAINLKTIDINKISGKKYKGQWEGIASDDSGRLYLLQEYPSRIVIIHEDLDKLVSEIQLEITKDLKNDIDWSKKNSGGEGIALLKNGNILIAKEKKPLRLIEFSPTKLYSRGFSPALALDNSGSFPLVQGANQVDFFSTNYWKFDKKDNRKFKDVSEMSLDKNNRLFLLSDESHVIAYIGEKLLTTGNKIEFQKLYELPSDFKKAEGMVIDDQDRPIISIDSKKKKKDNLFLLSPL